MLWSASDAAACRDQIANARDDSDILMEINRIELNAELSLELLKEADKTIDDIRERVAKSEW